MKVCEGCKERTYNFFLNFGCKTMLLLNYVNEKMYCVHVMLFTFQFGHLVFVKHFYKFCHKWVKRCVVSAEFYLSFEQS